MMKNIKESDKYFGEYVYYDPTIPEEYHKATEYLEFWKENQIRKIRSIVGGSVEIISADWVERPAHMVSMLALYGTLGLKIVLRAKWDFELS